MAGGVAGLLAGSVLSANSTSTPSVSLEEAPVLATELISDSPLAQRMNALEEDMVLLEGQLMRMREEAGQGPRRAAESPDVHPLAAAAQGAVFEESVLEVLEAREEAQLRRQEARRAEQAQSRMDRRMERYTADLNLSPYQTQEMGRILLDQDQKIHAFFEGFQAADGLADHGDIRKSMTDLRAGTREQLVSVLSADQLSQYEESSQGISIEVSDFGHPGGATTEVSEFGQTDG